MGQIDSLVKVELMWVQDKSSWRRATNALNVSYMKKVTQNKQIIHINFLEQRYCASIAIGLFSLVEVGWVELEK